jgi:putative aldouronate transport system permease protein
MSSKTNDVHKKKGKTKLKQVISFAPIYLMMLPGLIYFFINNYMPMPGTIIAFKTYSAKLGIFKSPWAGLKNFRYLFATDDAWVITRNTILYNLSFIIVNTVLAIIIAIMLSEMKSKKFKKFSQSVLLLPYLISWVIVSYLAYAFLSGESGFFNMTIMPLLGKESVGWYSDSSLWPPIIIFANAWKTVGYSCIIYLATILGIDRGFYEAAAIDGASKWQQIAHITLPMLKPTIILLTLLAVGRIFYSDFGLFYQVPMNSGALYSTTNTIDTYVYRGLLQLNNISMSSAAGLYQSFVGFVLIMGSNLLVRKIDRENALF